jgi:hypothetical protein
MFAEERQMIDSVPLIEKPFSGSALLAEVRELLNARVAE